MSADAVSAPAAGGTPTGGGARRGRGRRIALAAGGVLAFLVAAEVALRGYDAWRGYDSFSRVPGWFLFVPDPFAGYRLRPGLTLRRGWTLSVNDLGFRGAPVATRKPEGTVRIVCLGGSSTFCDGVSSDAAAWPARLQEALRARPGLPPVEVVNAGCSGYTSSQSLGQFLGHCAALSPDWVVLYQGWNDVKWWPHLEHEGDWCRFQKVYHPPLWYDRLLCRSALWGAVRMRILASRTREFSPGTERQGFGPAGPAIWERNLRALAAGARACGTRLLLCSEARRLPRDDGGNYAFPWPGVDRATVRGGFDALDGIARRVAAEEGGASYLDVDGAVPDGEEMLYDHIHLTDQGARRVAQVLAEALAPRLVERSTR